VEIKSAGARVCLDPCEQRLRHSAATGDIAHVHALYLGEASKKRQRATADCAPVRARQKEPYTGGEDRIQRQTVPLLGGYSVDRIRSSSPINARTSSVASDTSSTVI
jgi:hypothetical protein